MSSREPDGDSPDFEESADRLYGLPPTEFTAARDEQAQLARAAGDAALAQRLRALRKPTQSAWLVNLLWREKHDVVEQLLALGTDLRAAQEHLSGDALRELFAQRQRIIGALVQQARHLASRAGIRVPADTAREVEETLGAALADPDVAEDVRSGRLVKPASYAGFGLTDRAGLAPDVRLVKPTRPAERPRPPRPDEAQAARAAQADRAQAAREAQQKRRAEAEQAVAAAAAVVRDAEARAEASRQTLAEASTARDDLRESLAVLRERVLDTERSLAQAELDLRAGSIALRRAVQAIGDAQRRLERAQRARAALDES